MTERTIFLTALDIEPSRRAGYLDEACGDDLELRKRVEALLAAESKSGDFLDVPAAEQLGGGNDRSDPDLSPAAERAAAALAILTPSEDPNSLGRLGSYEIREVLGSGGFGTVLKAFDVKLERLVAVKLLAPELAITSPPRKRFLREARAAAQVRHENVVGVFAVVEQPHPYLVMEYIPGETLQQTIDRLGPLDVADVIQIGRQIALGLAAAHAVGLVHRDVKPGNILIEAGTQQRVKITDFGLARTIDEANVTQSGTIIGTPMYMSPEQAHGQALDQRSDLFSLGSVLYLLITGRPPFRATSTLSILRRVVDDDPRPIRDLVPETPEWLVAVIERLHAKDPAERFLSAGEVVEALRLGQGGASPLRPRRRAHGGAGGTKLRALLVTALVAALLLNVLYVARQAWWPWPTVDPPAEWIAESDSATGPRGESLALDIDNWDSATELKKVAAAPIGVQRATVLRALSLLNHSNEPALFEVADGAIIGLQIPVQAGRDLRPIAALRRLEKLTVAPNAQVQTTVDLRPLLGLRLREFAAPFCRVASFTPLEGMPLQKVDVRGIEVDYLSPLTSLPIQVIDVDVYGEKELAFLRRFGNLQRINGLTADEFWRRRAAPAATQTTTPPPTVAATDRGAPSELNPSTPVPTMTPPDTIATSADVQVKNLKNAWLERNWFAPDLSPTITRGVLVDLTISSPDVLDLSPLAPLKTLTRLSIHQKRPNDFNDGEDLKSVSLAPLEGMRLEKLNLSNLNLKSLDGLRGIPLQELAISGSHRIETLEPLTGMPLTKFSCLSSKVSDLSPLKGMKLVHINVSGSELADLSPLLGMPLQQVFVGGNRVRDLSPVAELPMTVFSCQGSAVHDLSPLAKTRVRDLNIGHTAVTDLNPLKGLPLTHLNCQDLQITDLSPLAGMPLRRIDLSGTGVTDLEALRGMPLVEVMLVKLTARRAPGDVGPPTRFQALPGSKRRDLEPLRGLPIMMLTAVIETPDDLDVLRSLEQLQRINFERTEDFWKRVDALPPGEAPSPAISSF